MPDIRANHSGDAADRLAADRLDAVWDDLVQTGSADRSSATDGDAARLSLISYAGLLVPRSDPASRERIRRRLFTDYPEGAMRTAPTVWTASASVGNEQMPLPRPWPAPSNARPWWRRPIGMLELAITTVLILATIGGIALLQPKDEPRSLPAASSPDLGLSTPTTADDPSSEELITLKLDGAPSTSYSIELTRVTMDGGTRWELVDLPFASVSTPFDLYIDTGTLVVGGSNSESTFQDEDRPGLDEAPSYLRNPGQVPVTFVMAIAYARDQTQPEAPSGVTLNPLGSVPIPAIAGNPEVVVRLTWAALAPNSGTTLPIAPKMSTVFVAVESGTLLAHTVPGAPVRSGRFGPEVTGATEQPDFSEAPEDGIEVGPGETLTLDRTFVITDSAVVGDDPVEVLALSYTVEDEGVPESLLNPGELTFHIESDDGRIAFQLYRITLSPDSDWRYRSDAALIVKVIEGNVALSDGTNSSSPLGPDELTSFAGLADLHIRATGAGPAVIIAAVAFDEAHPPEMGGSESRTEPTSELMGAGVATLSTGTSRMMLYTESLSPDPTNSLVGLNANEASLIGVLAGEVDVVRYGGQVSLFGRSRATDDEPISQGREYPFGVKVTASAGDAVVAQPRSGYSLSTQGEETPELARLWISSETPIDMTTPGPRGDEPISFGGDVCQVDPRPADDLRRLVEISDGAQIDSGLRDEASTAQAADDTMTAEITADVREALACSKLGTPLQGYALFTDNALLAGAVANGLTLEEIDEIELVMEAEYPPGFIGTFSIDEISLFPDGRAGAWIFTSGELAYLTLVFDQETGRWLIDAWDDRERGEPAATTPEA